MSTFLASNNATTTLAGAITNTSLTANLSSGAGALFPSPGANQYFVGTLTDASTGLIREVVWVTARSSDTITMVRAQEGTTAEAWSAGDFFSNLMTAGQLEDLLQNGQLTYYYGVDTGSANAYVTALTPALSAMPSAGFTILLNALNPNTMASTLNATGSAVSIFRHDGTILRSGDIVTGENTVVSDGTHWRVLKYGRAKLLANQTFFISTTGNDTHDGLTSGTAWLTKTGAWNNIAAWYDGGGFTGTVSVANGTYTDGLLAQTPLVGFSSFNFVGNTGSPSSCIVSTTNADCFNGAYGTAFNIAGFKMTTTTGGSCISGSANIGVNGAVEFGACADLHVGIPSLGRIALSANYTISGSAVAHLEANFNSLIVLSSGITVTLTGTPAFSDAFVSEVCNSTVLVSGVTFTGSATGKRYDIQSNSVTDTLGGGASFLPGSSAGTTATGGQYI